jgi:hypothetical protein
VNQVRLVTVTFSTLAPSSYSILNIAEAAGGADSLVAQTMTVLGSPIISHLFPFNGGQLTSTDTLRGGLGHPSGINTATVKAWIDGGQKTIQVTSTQFNATPSQLQLSAGTHTWRSTACANNGRCDTVTTSFTALPSVTPFNLDDSLPAPQGTGIAGLLGGLPLPPTNLRGCPVTTSSPEIRLSSPVSFLSQPGDPAVPGSGGLVFAASLGLADTLVITAYFHDYPNGDPTTCADYGYASFFDWNYWPGTNKNDPLWDHYPFSDSLLLGTLIYRPKPSFGETSFEFALGFETSHHHGPYRSLENWQPHRRGSESPMPVLASGGRGSRRAMMLPDPGAINDSSRLVSIRRVDRGGQSGQGGRSHPRLSLEAERHGQDRSLSRTPQPIQFSRSRER